MKSKSLQMVWLIAGMTLTFSLFPLRAEKVDADKAGRLAQRFVESKRQLPVGDAVRLKYIATQKQRINRTAQPNEVVSLDVQDTVFYYVFNVNVGAGGGFVIVSGDDAVTPVLGYSDSGSYDENDLPPNFVYWMDYLQQEIRWAITQKLPQSETVRQKWNDYLNGKVTNAVTTVAPLVRTTWGQGDPYWRLCPEVGNRRSVTGCVATAMAQIMNYHRHPARGTGQSAAYTTRTSMINVPSVNLEVNYDWANMDDSYKSGNLTEQQKEAVAILMYHCGVTVQMDYTPDGSGAFSQDVPGVLSKHFGYDTGCSYVSRPFSNSVWESTIKAQLDAGLPVYYSGHNSKSGHAFICDGYRDDGTFHFNWGWGGRDDDWFVTTALNTTNGSYNSTQGIVINIRPAVHVPATGVSLNKTSTTVLTGSTEQLTATVTPNNATNKNVTWSSSNTAAATVNGNGLVTGVSEGTSTITVTTQDGGIKAACLVTVIQSQSTNADLTALTVNPGALAPAFNANVTAYTVNVANQISTITVSATAADSRATVAGTGVCPLDVGNNTISVTVTAHNGSTQKTYTITVTRAAPGNTANLSALSVNRGTLTPAFDAATTAYSVDVDNNTASITVQAIPADANATVTGTGVHLLNTGSNTLRVEVTAADQTTKRTYTITVVRSGVTEDHDVYAVGTEYNGSRYVAKYWKNGAPVSITNGQRHAEALSIAVSGNDVYAAGYENNTNEYMVAMYWKNGTAYPLSNGTNNALASSIYVQGNDIYAVGWADENVMVAKYWKNGVETALTDGRYNAVASEVVVSGGIVYVAGYEENANGYLVAKYWKDGTAVSLTTGTRDAYARSITVSNGDVYVAGEEYSGSKWEVKYWRNIIAVTLPNGYQGESIAVSGNDIYVAGFDENSNDRYIAKYWKNGVASLLSNGSKDARAMSIVVVDNDVYVAGYEENVSNFNDIAKYWKNGVSVALTDGTRDAAAYQIVVMPSSNPVNNADLSALIVNQGTMVPAFSANVTAYTIDVANSVTGITVQATPADVNATITGTGVHSLILGSNTIPVEVTARDGSTKKTYTITVVRASAISADPYEPNDTPDQASVLPVSFLGNAVTVKTTGANFHTETDVDYYKIDLPSGYQYKITVRLHDSWNSGDGNTYTVDAGFRYSMDGTTWTGWFDDVMMDNITIPNGGPVYFHVVPYFTGYMGTYLLDITMVRSRIEGYSNADLSSLSVSPATLTPVFNAATTAYTVHVDNSVTGITVSATPADPGATITGTGIRSLDVGSNIISVAVTAQDGITSKTYSIVVIRELISGEDDIFGQALTVYPNPAIDRITINGMKGSGILTVFDTAGRRWIQQNIKSPEETIIVNFLPIGSYLVQIVEGKNVKTIKIIKN